MPRRKKKSRTTTQFSAKKESRMTNPEPAKAIVTTATTTTVTQIGTAVAPKPITTPTAAKYLDRSKFGKPGVKAPTKKVRSHFNKDALKIICEMHESEFGDTFGMEKFIVDTPSKDWRTGELDDDGTYYYFRDHGSKILAVAHLDTVIDHKDRMCNFVDTAAGPIVFSGALDDRLGAYTILELLPSLGIQFDILLTTGEECGQSTARFFNENEKEYNWMIEFDRGGSDVVMYQYEDKDTEDLVYDSGAKVGQGSFSDIAFMEFLEIKGFNWGVGYKDYHGPRGHAYLEDYWQMIAYFLNFHEANAEVYLPHERAARGLYGYSSYGGRATSRFADEEEFEECPRCESDNATYQGYCYTCQQEIIDIQIEMEEEEFLREEEERQDLIDAVGDLVDGDPDRETIERALAELDECEAGRAVKAVDKAVEAHRAAEAAEVAEAVAAVEEYDRMNRAWR